MRKFILGTDWWSDCDDAVALRLLARAHIKGSAELLGIVINAAMEYSAPSVDGFLRLEGCDNIPLGIDLAATDFGKVTPYQERLAPYAEKYKTNYDAEDGVSLYRRLLAEADSKVEIIEIGYLQAIAALLRSPADSISEKTGLELVSEKVSRIWVMAGKWDRDGERENNFMRNRRAIEGGRTFLELCPVPVTFLGWEVGYGVLTGGNLPHTDHLWQALNDHGSGGGRHSWDPMLTLLALTGDAMLAGYREVSGRATLDIDGCNHFEPSADGIHSFVIKNEPDSFYESIINRLID